MTQQPISADDVDSAIDALQKTFRNRPASFLMEFKAALNQPTLDFLEKVDGSVGSKWAEAYGGSMASSAASAKIAAAAILGNASTSAAIKKLNSKAWFYLVEAPVPLLRFASGLAKNCIGRRAPARTRQDVLDEPCASDHVQDGSDRARLPANAAVAPAAPQSGLPHPPLRSRAQRDSGNRPEVRARHPPRDQDGYRRLEDQTSLGVKDFLDPSVTSTDRASSLMHTLLCIREDAFLFRFL